MKRIVLSLAIGLLMVVCDNIHSAAAADLPVKKSALTPVAVAVPNPFFGFIDFGLGASTTQSELTFQGVDIIGQTPKQYPTGVLVGGGIGAEWGNTAIGGLGFEARIHYNFDRASFGCGVDGSGCQGYSKNSWVAQELVYWAPLGTTPLAFTGWGWTQALNVWLGAGAAERTVDACLFTIGGVPAFQAGSDGTVCDTKLLVGYDIGGKITAPLSADGKWKFRLTLDYIGYNEEVIHKNSPVFGIDSSYKLDHEIVGLAGVQYNFSF